MTEYRPQPSPTADKLWKALHKAGNKGLTAFEAENSGLASEAYARRRLRVWAEAGFLDVEEGVERISPHRYRINAIAPKTAPAVLRDETVIVRDTAMTAAEFARVRRKLDLSAVEFGRRLGWSGHFTTVNRMVRRIEAGQKSIDAALAAKVRALLETSS